MPRRSMNGVRVHVIVTKPQHKRLVALSEGTGLPVSELLRRAIDSYVTPKNKASDQG
jgi:hypothetical protein